MDAATAKQELRARVAQKLQELDQRDPARAAKLRSALAGHAAAAAAPQPPAAIPQDLRDAVLRSDARSAQALTAANAATAQASELRALVLEMTARLNENTKMLRDLRVSLGEGA